MIGLKYLRSCLGIQAKQLADELGINKQNVTLWEKRIQKIPEKHLQKLADKYECGKEDLQNKVTYESMIRLNSAVVMYATENKMDSYIDTQEKLYLQNELKKINNILIGKPELIDVVNEVIRISRDPQELAKLKFLLM